MKKRFNDIFDFVLALFLIVLSLPIMILICLVMYFTIGGKVIFSQKRPGFRAKIFRIYKFRTMVVSNGEGFKLTQRDDKRITVIGRYLRKSHLDELPQLFNILKGEMSFVGPRPVPLELYQQFKSEIKDYDKRHTVKPGLTGFSQIHLSYVNTIDGETVKWMYDMYYISQKSIALDFYILLKTLNFRRRLIEAES